MASNQDNQTYNVTADELRQFIEQYEQLDREKKDIAEQQKDLMSEAKARGYDTKAMKKIIAERKRDKNDIDEENAILELYRAALGMSGVSPGHADDEEEDGDGVI